MERGFSHLFLKKWGYGSRLTESIPTRLHPAYRRAMNYLQGVEIYDEEILWPSQPKETTQYSFSNG